MIYSNDNHCIYMNLKERNRLAQEKRRLNPIAKQKDKNYRSRPDVKKASAIRSTEYQNNPKNWHRYILTHARSRAKKSGMEFNITIEDIPLPEFCPVLGIKLERVRNQRAVIGGTSPSVDRIDNTKGYVKGNVQVISMRANQIKRDMTLDEAKKVYEYMKENWPSL